MILEYTFHFILGPASNFILYKTEDTDRRLFLGLDITFAPTDRTQINIERWVNETYQR